MIIDIILGTLCVLMLTAIIYLVLDLRGVKSEIKRLNEDSYEQYRSIRRAEKITSQIIKQYVQAYPKDQIVERFLEDPEDHQYLVTNYAIAQLDFKFKEPNE